MAAPISTTVHVADPEAFRRLWDDPEVSNRDLAAYLGIASRDTIRHVGRRLGWPPRSEIRRARPRPTPKRQTIDLALAERLYRDQSRSADAVAAELGIGANLLRSLAVSHGWPRRTSGGSRSTRDYATLLVPYREAYETEPEIPVAELAYRAGISATMFCAQARKLGWKPRASTPPAPGASRNRAATEARRAKREQTYAFLEREIRPLYERDVSYSLAKLAERAGITASMLTWYARREGWASCPDRLTGRYMSWDATRGKALFDAGWSPREIARALEVSFPTIYRYAAKHWGFRSESQVRPAPQNEPPAPPADPPYWRRDSRGVLVTTLPPLPSLQEPIYQVKGL